MLRITNKPSCCLSHDKDETINAKEITNGT